MEKYTDEIVRIFVDESLEHLSDIENELLAIERQGADIDENLVNKVYRAAHSIKGGAGFMGLDNIKNLTHEMENVLGMIRARELVPDNAVISVLLLASDALRNLLNDIENSNAADINSHTAALTAITEGTPPPAPERKEAVKKASKPVTTVVNISLPDEEGLFSIPDEEITHMRKEGKHLYLIRIEGMKTDAFSGMIDDMKQCGVILKSKPALPGDAGGAEPAEDACYTIMFASVLKPADVFELLDAENTTVYIVNEDHTVKPAMGPAVAETAEETAPGPAPDETEKDAVDMAPAPPPEASPADAAEPAGIEPDAEDAADDAVEAPAPAPAAETPEKTDAAPKAEMPVESIKTQSLRVNIKLLDSLMTLAGELVLSRNQLLQSILRNDRRALEISGQRIDMITSELQEAIMHTRMQPVQNIFNKFPRVVRDLSMSLNKKIALTMEGKEVELDKSIIENLNDPMTHLIRNAADHGIESPEERIKKGKKPVGKLCLKAYHEAGQVNIEISDDGRGIDGEEIARSAVRKGLVSEELVKGMAPGEKVNLIFLPGFSMSDKITELSGRGVGMDVVKTNLDNLGGLVDIASEAGKGTTIHIKLPLTLAIIPSLLVSDNDERYAIPQVNVVELMRIPPSRIKNKIEQVGNARVVRLRDELLPLVRLSHVLRKGGNRAESDLISGRDGGGVNVVVVFTGIFKYGVIVDKLHDSEEIVVKPLGRHLRDCRGYAGATILGDGRVALILDVADLARMAELATLSGSLKEAEAVAEAALYGRDRQTMLLFRNSEKTRFAVPLELVERIEKIRCDDIEIAGGRRVIRFQDYSMPLFDVAEAASVDPFEEREHALVIVFFVAGMDVGILAIPPIDTVNIPFRMDETALRQPGISGSAVIDGRTTLIVDVIGVVEAKRPEWFAVERRLGQGRTGESKTVILAEDSRFFRNQMKCAIEDAGYNVLAAEDGMAAWDLLDKNADRVSLVVTDLEMPNLDGFGFARQIKDDERFSRLPVIAVSSLAGKEDIRRARESGVDHYQIKLDRRKLVQCLHQCLGPN